MSAGWWEIDFTPTEVSVGLVGFWKTHGVMIQALVSQKKNTFIYAFIYLIDV